MRIAHISDLHITTGTEFKKHIFDMGMKAVNSLDPQPDLIIVSGDITMEGILKEYQMAQELISGFNATTMLTPGNHDSRHLGYTLFNEFFGNLESHGDVSDVSVLGLDSSEPDLDEGHIGRDKYSWIEGKIKDAKDVKILCFHHHLVPVPNAGREQNILNDSGDVLDVVLRNHVALVLMGHRHVPYTIRVHNTLMVNAGTFSSSRTRAHLGNSFNIIDIEGPLIHITAHDIEMGKEKLMVEFDRDNGNYKNRHYDG